MFQKNNIDAFKIYKITYYISRGYTPAYTEQR